MWQSEATVLYVKIHTKHEVCSQDRTHIMQRGSKRVRQMSFEGLNCNRFFFFLLYVCMLNIEKAF